MKITHVETIVVNMPMIIEGTAVPQGPGLGIDPDPAVIAKLRVG